jgi:tetratricopeptide (TPR) repeat protein
MADPFDRLFMAPQDVLPVKRPGEPSISDPETRKAAQRAEKFFTESMDLARHNKYGKAIEAAKNGIEKEKEAFGPSSMKVVDELGNLARLCQSAGRNLDAGEAFEKIVQINLREKLKGPVGDFLNQKASEAAMHGGACFFAAGFPAKAEPMWKFRLDCCEQAGKNENVFDSDKLNDVIHARQQYIYCLEAQGKTELLQKQNALLEAEQNKAIQKENLKRHLKELPTTEV